MEHQVHEEQPRDELAALRARVRELEESEAAYRRALQELQGERAQLDAIIQSLPDAVYIGDATAIWRCNAAAYKMLGLESSASLQEQIATLAERIQTRHFETGERIAPEDEVFARALGGETLQRDVLIRQVDTGREMIVRSAAAPVWCEGKIIGAVAINTDITATKANQQEQARLYQEAQSALRTRDQVIAVTAHELKTPITALLGYAQMLQRRFDRRSEIEERDRAALKILIGQARRIDRMLTSYLSVERLQQGQLTVALSPLDLTSLVYGLLEEIRPALGRHSVAFVDSAGPLIVEGEAVYLEQIVYNLVQNAVKYSPAGGEIVVQVRREPGQACLSVQDRGIGIPAAAIPLLFERFYRAENVQAHRVSGLGIGLSVVKELVALHHGSISVESQEGQGSTFTVCLPFAR